MDDILRNLRKGFVAGDPEATRRYAAAMDRAFFGGSQGEIGDLEQKLERVQEYKAAFYAAMIALHESEHLRDMSNIGYNPIEIAYNDDYTLMYGELGFFVEDFSDTYLIENNRLVHHHMGEPELLHTFTDLTISQVRAVINKHIDRDPIYEQSKKEQEES